MPKVSAKRQITLPIELCHVADINAGDEYESFVDRQGVISIVKKSLGAAKGVLKGIPVDKSVTEHDSLESALK